MILRSSGGVSFIDLSGDFSDALEEDLRAAYEEVCQSHSPDIIIKFDEVSQIYSSGIAVLVGLIGEAEEREQKIHAIGLSEYFAQVFELTGLTKYIQIFPSEQEALAGLK